MKNASLLLCLVALHIAVPHALAEKKVYKWQDGSGVVHYSDRPLTKAAQPAELPPIMRAEVKLPKQKLESCSDHGGIDCQAGPDGDGSVICVDGFSGAGARFRFSCNSPKLSVADVSDARADGTYVVTVRNSKSVVATKPAVSFLTESGKAIALSGPEQIAAYGVAEFILSSSGAGGLNGKPNAVQFRASCANCPS